MGYSICRMAVFENGPIFRTFGVFPSGFLHRATVNHLQNGF